MQLLLESQADVHVEDKQGRSALHFASGSADNRKEREEIKYF